MVDMEGVAQPQTSAVAKAALTILRMDRSSLKRNWEAI
jgi:hypothetical protein